VEEVLGSSLSVFIGVTVVIFGFASFMTGQALAGTWRPMWQVFPYCLMLAAANRFFCYALFEGEIFSISGFIVSVVVTCAIGAAAYLATRAHKMVTQYPWLYERSGLFSWRPRRQTAG
jgi:branched-chain amino acid transport system ATP-binding protein